MFPNGVLLNKMKKSGSFQSREEDFLSPRTESPISLMSTPAIYEYIDEPIPLVTYVPNSQNFSLTGEGLDFLRSLSSPIGVISVAGLYRTGKSFLLNRVLLSRKRGFGVGPSVNPCTKGIWVWGRPLSGTTVDGSPCSVIIVDTEGIGALDQDSDHDARIFSLAVLMSSAFIYNSVGSIDEDALQNLSLVVSLTKHIHIKSKQKEETDSEEYAAYFPTFIWVVRDFALRLVDNDGEPLTPKEYLEKALQNQKGISDSVEDKNRIRRLLKEFFKDRDCYTLVRPVSNESDLQSLEEKENENLREEFVMQMLALRKNVLNGIKPKSLNEKLLNGDMLATLIENYVTAINKGAVPSIESAWNYICKNECSKALQDAQDIYERVIMNSVSVKFPLFEEDLHGLHKEAKLSALDLFKKRAVGPESEKILAKLKNTITEKYQTLKSENEVESEKKCTAFLNNAYGTIEQKLRNNEYKTFVDFEREIKKLQRFFNERGPEGPFKKEILLEFIQKKIVDTADYFIKESQNEIEFLEESYTERVKALETDLKETKDDLAKEKSEWQRKFTSAESERAELSAKEASLKEQLMSLKSEKDRVETELRNSMKTVRAELGQQVEAANAKAWENEEKMKETERLSSQKDSEFKEKEALMEQKVKYLETSLEESRKREKEYMNESRTQKKDHNSSIKDLQSRFENQIKTLTSRLEGETERVNELERELEEKERVYEREKQVAEENEIKLKATIEEKTQQLSAVTQEFKRSETLSKKQEKTLVKEYENTIAKLTAKLEETEKKLKSTEETTKLQLKTFQQENAILAQKLEFSEQHLTESKLQLEEERKQHANMLLSFNGSSGLSSDDLEGQLKKVRQQYSEEIKLLDQKNDAARKELLKQNETLSQHNNELELELKCVTSDFSHKYSELEKVFNDTSDERNKLRDQLNDLKLKLDQSSLETEQKFKKKIVTLEKEIEEMKNKHTEELQLAAERSENSFATLKEFYEAEKKRLEARLQDDKERAEKKYNLMVEEYEDRIRQDNDNFEDELAIKDDELREMDGYYNEEINSLKHQSGLDLQKIESLEKYLKENKEQIEIMQKAHALALEQTQERMNSERSSLLEKIEKLANDLAAKERELASTMYKKEQVESQLAHRDSELEDIRAQYEKEKQTLSERAESLKLQLTQITDDFNQKRNDFKRELALANQELDFKNKKIVDLERSLHDSEEKYSEALKSLRDESGQELSATIEKLTRDKESLEQKLEQKKKSLKEMITSSVKQIGGLEKEKAVLAEKLLNLEAKFSDVEERYKQEVENLNARLKEKKDAESSDKMSVHIDNERLRTLLQELEKEMAERASASERERILWENKHQFLIQQRDSAKLDLAEAQRKFDVTLEQIQKKTVSDKEKLEGNSTALIASMEARHSSQVKDMQENYSTQITNLNSKIKAMEKEMRTIREELELEKRGRNANSGNLEKRLAELTENEQKNLAEIENLKAEKEKKIEEMQENFVLERNQFKNKISELEKRAKDAEHIKGNMFLDHEKEKAKWAMEKDNIMRQRNEAYEQLERSEKKKENLLRENEKLKVERGKNRNQPVPGLFRRPDTNTQQYKQGVSNFLAGAGISFEEFAREQRAEEVPSPKSRDEEMVSPNPVKRGFTPSNIKERKRSGFGADRPEKPDS